ncbi:MAG: hypothetical protein JXA19_01780 [Anaerolineales bacterium]|nr:hypothetical protein [Anaerolineales bacterium]
MNINPSIHLRENCSGLTIISGVFGSGKTSWIQKALPEFKGMGKQLAGIYSPGVFENRIKTGIQIADLNSEEIRDFGRLAKPGDSGILTKRWTFNEEVIRWANDLFLKLPKHDILIIDELGPLEFERGVGLINAMKILDDMTYSKAYVVIRPHLVETARARWQVNDILTIHPEQ